MRQTIYFAVVATAVAVGMMGCSKSSTTAPVTPTAPAFPSVTFKGPATASTDANAQATIALATSANAYSNGAVFATFAGVNPAQSGNSWTWSYTAGNWSITFTETKQPDGSYTWQWVENGTNPNNHAVYSNWTFFSGSRSADGANGDWKVYYDSTTTLNAEFTWSTVSGVKTGSLKVYASNGITITDQMTVINNTDGSGEVDVYTGAVVTYKSTWSANGSGTWWTYSNTGTQTGTGTWS
ncbi:MAG TPA: hypothetical protein VI758_08985 [Bacteroidota bacterium]